MKSYLGLILGFGVLGGIGMGLGYAAATPAAVKWFGPQPARADRRAGRRRLRRGGDLHLAAGRLSHRAARPVRQLRRAGRALRGRGGDRGRPAASRRRPGTSPAIPPHIPDGPKVVHRDYSAREMLRTWQFYALVFLFIGSAQSGLLVIANAKRLLPGRRRIRPASSPPNAWLLASFGGFVNAAGRVGTGRYSDRIGRANAYAVNGVNLGRVPVRRAVGHRREVRLACCSWSSAWCSGSTAGRSP